MVPTSFSNYKLIYPAKMIVEVLVTQRSGKEVVKYRLEGEDQARRAETLELVSSA